MPVDLDRLRPVAEFSRDAWLMAAHGNSASRPCGRAWERAVCALLARPGIEQRQGPGRMTLFGRPSWSGCAHELDGAGRGWRDALLVECKAQAHGVSKEEVAAFDLKTFDFYKSELPGNVRDRWWRCIASATPTAEPIHRLCASLGIILCDPARLPLPYLMWLAAKPQADVELPDVWLQEVLRLGALAVQTMQQRWRHDEARAALVHTLGGIQAAEIGDLLFVQSELSEAVLDLHDRRCPGVFGGRAAWLLRYLNQHRVAA